MPFDEEEIDPHGECAAEIKRLQAEVASKNEQIGKLYKVCNERDVLKNALASLAYLEVENLGSEAESGRPPRYFECRLCGDWNDEAKHVEHADGCPLHTGFPRHADQQTGAQKE